MSKKTFLIIPLVLLSLASCNEKIIDATGDIITKEYTINENVNSLKIGDILLKNNFEYSLPEVTLHQGGNQKVIFTYEASLEKEIDIDVIEEELYIHGEPNVKYRSKGIKIDIYGCEFNELDLSCCDTTCEVGVLNTTLTEIDIDAASVFYIDTFEGSNLELDISGASSFHVANLNVDLIEAKVVGASSIKVDNLTTSYLDCEVYGASSFSSSGSASEIKLDVRGASTFKGVDNFLKVDKGNVLIEGASSCCIYVNESVTGKVEGASSLTYDGPGSANVTCNGASNIKKK